MFSWGGRHRRKGAKAEILRLICIAPQEVTPGPAAAMLGRSPARAGRRGARRALPVSGGLSMAVATQTRVSPCRDNELAVLKRTAFALHHGIHGRF